MLYGGNVLTDGDIVFVVIGGWAVFMSGVYYRKVLLPKSKREIN
jgi:hypothetical protein